MIKQTNLVFKLGNLEVYALTTVTSGSLIPNGEETIIPTMTEEIWWRDKENIAGHGPFTTLYGAMKHYEGHYSKGQIQAPPPPPPHVIPVDFKTKRRL